MSVKNVELFTCDDCKTVIVIGRGGVHFSCLGGERLTAKWAGGFQEHGQVPKGHAVTPYPIPKGCASGPFDGLEAGSPRGTVTLCRKCLARRLGFEDGEPPADPEAAGSVDRFHRDPV